MNTEQVGVAVPASPEIKPRITRSSIGQAIVTPQSGPIGDGPKLEELSNSERSSSPFNNRSTRSRTMTPTPTQEMPETGLPAENVIHVSKKMGISPMPQQALKRTLRSNKLNTDEESDTFCWICRKDGTVIACQLCPRVFHVKCLGLLTPPKDDYICVECEKVMRSECEDTKPKALINLPVDQLILCLQFALERMKVPNSEVFQVPVDPALEPEYHKIIAHPMDMSQLDKNIKKKLYGSTEAFLADVKWILHNSIVYNGTHNKYTMTAKAVVKVCRNQMADIETCPDCFLSSCTQESNWFCKPCKLSHPLVWAKLKGYPFWPAKALREVEGQVDCRFFGAHDRAWVPANQVYMLSEEPPAPVKNKKGSGFDDAMAELDRYIMKFKAKYGTFSYAPMKELYKADIIPQNNFELRKKKIISPTSASETSEVKRPTEEVVNQLSQAMLEENSDVSINHQNQDDEQKPQLEICQQTTETCKQVNNVKDVPVRAEPVKPVNLGVFTVSDDVIEAASKLECDFLTEETLPVTNPEPSIGTLEKKLMACIADEEDSSNLPSDVCEEKEVAEDRLQVTAVVTVIEEKKPDTDKNPVKDYLKPLGKTIENCMSQLNCHNNERTDDKDEEESDSSEDSESESEEEVVYRRKRRRSGNSHEGSSKRGKLEDLLTEKEKGITEQLLKLMADGLQSTILDVVKRALAGDTKVQSNQESYRKPVVENNESSLVLNQSNTCNQITNHNMDTLIYHSDDEFSSQTTAAENQNSNATNLPTSNSKISLQQSQHIGHLANGELKPTNGNVNDLPLDQNIADHLKNLTSPKGEPLTPTQISENKISDGNLPKSETIANEMIEKLKWKQKCEIEAIKHNAELATLEMRKSIELEKERALWRLRKQLEHKYKRMIEETKKKQWCAMCGKEAIFYCCWNTSYCDYPCQQKHWPNHLKTCAQIQKEDNGKKTPQASLPSEKPLGPTSNTAPPPPYISATTSANSSEVAAYHLMAQYMPVPSNAGHVYQAQVPLQAIQMPGGPRNSATTSGAPLLYPVMQPPSVPGPPPPQSFMIQQRHPYRLAPKYN